VDLNTGDIRWRATLGEFDELKQRGIAKTGAPNIGGSIVTDGGLVFIAATSDRSFAPLIAIPGRYFGRQRCRRAASPLPQPTSGKNPVGSLL
jgi:glucose dehydrogenase